MTEPFTERRKAERRNDKIRIRLESIYQVLTYFVVDRREPKEIARIMGKPGWWVRRRIRAMDR